MTPSVRLCGLGILLCFTMIVFSRVASTVGGPWYLATLALAAILYLATIRELARTAKYPRWVIVAGLVIGTAWQIPFLLVVPGAEDDVLRYVWDGRLQKFGLNPYTAIPSDPALAFLHTDETRQMNHQDLPSPYPAGAQLFFRAVVSLRESAFAFKVAFGLCNSAIILLLFVELGRSGREHWTLAYAWHPLLVTCVYYNSHIDVLGVLLLLISMVAVRRHYRTLAAVAFGLAIAVKFLPAVLAPLYFRRVRVRDALWAALAVGLLYAPFLRGGGLIPTGSLHAFVERFRFNDPLFAVLEQILRPSVAAIVAVASGLAVAIWVRLKTTDQCWGAWAWPLAASLIWLPVIYPWYLLWMTPLLNGESTFPILIWTLSILSVFYVWHSHALGQAWQVSGWVMVFEYGSVAAACIGALLRRGKLWEAI